MQNGKVMKGGKSIVSRASSTAADEDDNQLMTRLLDAADVVCSTPAPILPLFPVRYLDAAIAKTNYRNIF